MKRNSLFLFLCTFCLFICSCKNFYLTQKATIRISLPGSDSRAADDSKYSFDVECFEGSEVSENPAFSKSAETGDVILFEDVKPGEYTVRVRAYEYQNKEKLLYEGQDTQSVVAGEVSTFSIILKKLQTKGEEKNDVIPNSLKWKTDGYLCSNNPDWSLLNVQRFCDDQPIDSDFVKAEEFFDIAFAETLTENVRYAGYVPLVLTAKDKSYTANISIPMVLDLDLLYENALLITVDPETSAFTIIEPEIKVTFIDENAKNYEWTIPFDNEYLWYENETLIENATGTSYKPNVYVTSTFYCKAVIKPVVGIFAEILGELSIFNKQDTSMLSAAMTYDPKELQEGKPGYHFKVEYPEDEEAYVFFNLYVSSRGEYVDGVLIEYPYLRIESFDGDLNISDIIIFWDGEKITPTGNDSGTNYVEYYFMDQVLEKGWHEIICFITLEGGRKITKNYSYCYDEYNIKF